MMCNCVNSAIMYNILWVILSLSNHSLSSSNDNVASSHYDSTSSNFYFQTEATNVSSPTIDTDLPVRHTSTHTPILPFVSGTYMHTHSYSALSLTKTIHIQSLFRIHQMVVHTHYSTCRCQYTLARRYSWTWRVWISLITQHTS